MASECAPTGDNSTTGCDFRLVEQRVWHRPWFCPEFCEPGEGDWHWRLIVRIDGREIVRLGSAVSRCQAEQNLQAALTAMKSNYRAFQFGQR